MLTVSAPNLTDASGDSIVIGKVSWTATGTRFRNGTLSTTSVTVGSGPKGTFRSTITLKFKNAWTYTAGSYTTTLTYVLVAM